jgi:hypothetical protein
VSLASLVDALATRVATECKSIRTALALKAPLASPAFTGTPTGITATHVGLGSVNNTSDAAKPVSTAQQTALDLKANLDRFVFTRRSTIIDNNTVTYSTVLGPVTLTGGNTYTFRVRGNYETGATTTGIRLKVNGTATCSTMHTVNVFGVTSASVAQKFTVTTMNTESMTTASLAVSTNYWFELEGLVVCTVTGTFQLQYASEVAASNVRIASGTYLELEQVI